MAKNRPLLLAALAGLLVLVTALAFVVGRGPQTQAAGNGLGLTVPSAGMVRDANWKAQPVQGERANLPWANIRVNSDSSTEAQNEPFVAVNPNNANHLVVGANSWQVGNGTFEVFAYVSFDGGQSWATSQPYIDRNPGRVNAADPTVAFGSDGAVYFAFVALTPAQGAVAVSRSADGGLTWSSQTWATSFALGADKPSLVAAAGNLHLFYQGGPLLTKVSSDGASTWGASAVIDAVGRNAAPVVDSAGKVSVFYNTNNSIKLARISGSNINISTVSSAVALQPRPTGYRASVYPAAGVDSKGNMYVAWADGRNVGSGNDILLSRSVNGGRAWTAPVRLNTDGTSADQLMPALAVSQSGAVSVAWLDNRNDSANINYDVYMSTSYNAGQSFGVNQRVSEVSSNPYNDPRTQGTMIGDYFAMAAGNGVVYTLWCDTRNNNEDIYMAPVGVGSPTN